MCDVMQCHNEYHVPCIMYHVSKNHLIALNCYFLNIFLQHMPEDVTLTYHLTIVYIFMLKSFTVNSNWNCNSVYNLQFAD